MLQADSLLSEPPGKPHNPRGSMAFPNLRSFIPKGDEFEKDTKGSLPSRRPTCFLSGQEGHLLIRLCRAVGALSSSRAWGQSSTTKLGHGLRQLLCHEKHPQVSGPSTEPVPETRQVWMLHGHMGQGRWAFWREGAQPRASTPWCHCLTWASAVNECEIWFPSVLS